MVAGGVSDRRTELMAGSETHMANIRVTHSQAQERYEIFDGEQYVGYLDYVSEPEQVLLTHTVVLDQFSGRGYAGHLVKYVLDDIERSGKKVVPLCSYVGYFIEQNPEYAPMATEVIR
jgi:predicted GNAT family acetyltransferase